LGLSQLNLRVLLQLQSFSFLYRKFLVSLMKSSKGKYSNVSENTPTMGVLIFQVPYWGRFIITFPAYQANNSDGSVIWYACKPF